MADKRTIAADILRWGKEQKPPVGTLLSRKDVAAYTGLHPVTVGKLLSGLPRVGGKTTYFYTDVVDRIVSKGARV